MTEAERFTVTHPVQLFDAVDRGLTVRQRRLIALAGCQLLAIDLLGPGATSWLAAAERLAERPDVTLSSSGMRRRLPSAWMTNIHDATSPADIDVYSAFFQFFTANVRASLVNVGLARRTFDRAQYDGPDPTLADIVRDIVGNPFRPVAFSPDWQTTTAVAISLGMYDSRDFSAMPILADALQDAGCDNDVILNHCRDVNGVHVRGCWVVDLVMGKA